MDDSAPHPIAYFCAEYGLESRLPLYAGGLGVLAGDTLKAADDAGLPVVAVGLLYRGESAIQRITPEGLQVEDDMPFDPIEAGLELVILEDMPLFVKVHLTETEVWLGCWKKELPNGVTLYLLDSHVDQNHASERGITHALYYGTEEELLKQQLLLGIGGVKLLHSLGIFPSLYHVNEGRPAFLHWQLIRNFMDKHGVNYPEAVERAKGMTVYTNHTLVGAGNPSASVDLLKVYGQYYSNKMGISIDELLSPGIEGEDNHFSTTRFALNTSRKANAVSQLHGEFCQQRWPEYNWAAITNGVHQPTWQSEPFRTAQLDTQTLWEHHLQLKRQLMEFVQQRSGFGYDPNHLVVTWARRITGYKQLGKVFADVGRLRAILKDTQRPVQLLVAGKTHHQDTHAKAHLQSIIRLFQQELAGSALFIPNYDLDLARHLVQGSDVWLNIPEYGKEASGTSGMKAAANGVLNMTVADGWAHEVEWDVCGWKLDHTRISESVYETLEQQVVPLYHQRNAVDVPTAWVEKMRQSIALIDRYSAARMMREYQEQLYS